MMNFQSQKQLVLDLYDKLEAAPAARSGDVLGRFVSDDYQWFGVHPFNARVGAAAVAEQFWEPLRHSFARLQRRQDVFFAGHNERDARVWTLSMGHFLGVFENPWLGIPPTQKIALLRYAEFQCVENKRIVAGSMFCDVIGMMAQAGVYPLAPETGVSFAYPGPRTHDGLLLTQQDAAESAQTLALIETMIDDLSALNLSGNDACPPATLARTWHDNMLWYGPAGIGASYTIARYQQQHQHPFRQGLKNKVFNGHVCRIAEGTYAGFFGWPNLTNTAAGGFLGLPGNDIKADMRVVDVYRRDGDKLAENWVFIDLPYWLLQQGLDVLQRQSQLGAPLDG